MKNLGRIILFLLVSNSYALGWQDLWHTPDQQAESLMKNGQFEQAQTLFQDEAWKASAAYRNGNYKQAAQDFKSLNSEDGFYNEGNALAHLGEYEKAINAYDAALNLNPANQDAQFNRKLVEALLKKEQEKNKKSDQQKSDDKQNKEQQKQDSKAADNQPNKDGSENKNQQNANQQQDKNKDQAQPENKKDQDKKNNQSAGEKQDKNQEKSDKNKGQQTAKQSIADKEKKQAKEQWLRLIPDDPGGLMRGKFLRDYLRMQGGWYQ